MASCLGIRAYLEPSTVDRIRLVEVMVKSFWQLSWDFLAIGNHSNRLPLRVEQHSKSLSAGEKNNNVIKSPGLFFLFLSS